MAPSTTTETPAVNKEQLANMISELQQEVLRLREEQKGMKKDQGELKATARPSFKVPRPEPYRGEGSAQAWFTQVQAYIEANASSLPTWGDRVTVAAGLLTGKAAEWFEPMLRDYTDNRKLSECREDTQKIYSNLSEFKKKFLEAFGNPDEKRIAVRRLMNLKQTGSASSYTREFTTLATKVGWDDAALIEQYYKGLRDDVKDDLSREKRPVKLHDFTTKTIEIDNRIWERKMEKKGSYRPMASSNTGKPKQHRSTAYGHHAGPMELDVFRKEKKRDGRKCYNCQKPGHFAKNCRQPRKNKFQGVPTKGAHVAQREPMEPNKGRSGYNVVHEPIPTPPSIYYEKGRKGVGDGPKTICATKKECDKFPEHDQNGTITPTYADSEDEPFPEESLKNRETYLQESRQRANKWIKENTIPEAEPVEIPTCIDNREYDQRQVGRLNPEKTLLEERITPPLAEERPDEEEWIKEWRKERSKHALRQEIERQTVNPHRLLHWTGCYDDDCHIHLSGKEGSNYFPKKPRKKAPRNKPSRGICVMEREVETDSDLPPSRQWTSDDERLLQEARDHYRDMKHEEDLEEEDSSIGEIGSIDSDGETSRVKKQRKIHEWSVTSLRGTMIRNSKGKEKAEEKDEEYDGDQETQEPGYYDTDEETSGLPAMFGLHDGRRYVRIQGYNLRDHPGRFIDILYEAVAETQMDEPQPFGENPKRHPKHKEHSDVSWMSCCYHACEVHLFSKIAHRWLPYSPAADSRYYRDLEVLAFEEDIRTNHELLLKSPRRHQEHRKQIKLVLEPGQPSGYAKKISRETTPYSERGRTRESTPQDTRYLEEPPEGENSRSSKHSRKPHHRDSKSEKKKSKNTRGWF